MSVHIGLEPIDFVYLLSAFVIGVALSFIRLKHGLIATIIMHIIINIITFAIV
jgi:membrane protease YdiL (CAAX protease family)